MMAFKLEAELFRLLDSKYVPPDFTDGVGLGSFIVLTLFTVEDAGIRGGGMLSCLSCLSCL